MSNRQKTRLHLKRSAKHDEDLIELRGMFGNRRERRAAVRKAGRIGQWAEENKQLPHIKPIFLGIRQFKQSQAVPGHDMVVVYKGNAWGSYYAMQARAQEQQQKKRGKLKDLIKFHG